MGTTNFGEKVKALRNEKGLTMEELAEQLKVNKSRISMWENNGTIPRQNVLLKLANFFHVSTDYLLDNPQYGAEDTNRKELQYLQRGLTKLNSSDLKKAEEVLSVVFGDIFEEEDDDDGV